MTQLLTRVGPQTNADGTTPPLRAAKEADLVVTQGGGKYTELCRRGRVFSSGQGASATPGTAVGTTAAFVLYNPVGSGKRLVLLRAAIAYISGTLGAGELLWCVNNNPSQAVPSGGTTVTAACNDVGAGATAVGVPRWNATVAAPTSTPRPICSMSPELATSVVGLQQITEDTDGEFIVEPGCSIQIQGAATAGTAPLLGIGVSWAELDAG